MSFFCSKCTCIHCKNFINQLSWWSKFFPKTCRILKKYEISLQNRKTRNLCRKKLEAWHPAHSINIDVGCMQQLSSSFVTITTLTQSMSTWFSDGLKMWHTMPELQKSKSVANRRNHVYSKSIESGSTNVKCRYCSKYLELVSQSFCVVLIFFWC